MTKDRTKYTATPKQNKWNNPFYAQARCRKDDNYHRNYDNWLNQINKTSPFQRKNKHGFFKYS